jgi:transcriptional regulator with XRE-family HTH domain
MGTKSFTALYAELEPTPTYQASALAVNFLAKVHARMQVLGMTRANLARKVGVSPAYITKLFRGSTDLSFNTMVKFSDAVDCKLHLRLVNANHRIQWFDEVAKRALPLHTDMVAATGLMQNIRDLELVAVHYDPAIQTDFFDECELMSA